jgi:hypothetical protein
MLLLIGMLLASGCTKNLPNNVFEIPFDNVRFTIPAGLSPFDAHFFIIRDIKLNKSFFYQQGRVSDPSKVRILPMSARILQFTSNVDFECIERISVQAFSPSHPTINLELFFRDPVPFRNGSTLNLIPTVSDLQPYTDDDEISLRIRIQLRYPTPEFIECTMEFRLRGEEIP